jgi:hypothetical protein
MRGLRFGNFLAVFFLDLEQVHFKACYPLMSFLQSKKLVAARAAGGYHQPNSSVIGPKHYLS